MTLGGPCVLCVQELSVWLWSQWLSVNFVCMAVVSVTADRLCRYVCYVCRNCVYGCGLNDCQQLGLTAAGDKGANKSLLPAKVSKRYGSQNLCLYPSNKTALMYWVRKSLNLINFLNVFIRFSLGVGAVKNSFAHVVQFTSDAEALKTRQGDNYCL